MSAGVPGGAAPSNYAGAHRLLSTQYVNGVHSMAKQNIWSLNFLDAPKI